VFRKEHFAQVKKSAMCSIWNTWLICKIMRHISHLHLIYASI